MGRTLVIGYGNIERGDDGAALHVVNRLRARWGQTPLTEDQVGLEARDETGRLRAAAGARVGARRRGLRVIVMVDVHVAQEGRPVACRRVLPEYRPPAFSHIVSPALFVWLVHAARGRHRSSFLVTPEGTVSSCNARCRRPRQRWSARTAGRSCSWRETTATGCRIHCLMPGDCPPANGTLTAGGPRVT